MEIVVKASELGDGTALILGLFAIGGDQEAIEAIQKLEPEDEASAGKIG